MNPGSNLLLQAFRLLRPTKIDYFVFSGRTLNAVRNWQSSFGAATPIYCAVQPVQQNTYKQFGLDLQKKYVTVWAAKDIIDISRDTSGDRFIYKGRLYQLESENTWVDEDGWDKCIAVDIGLPVNGGPGA